MKLAVMQPYLFPYLGYFQLLYAVDTFVIYDDVNYINKGYINRNAILVNGQGHQFTLEILGASQNKHINELQVGHSAERLLKTIMHAYRRAPYFKQVFALLELILLNPETNLALFIGNSLDKIKAYLGLTTRLFYSSALDKNNLLCGQDKILDICACLKAETYINAIGGRALYNPHEFNKSNIKLFFIKSTFGSYKQFDNVFVPNLSIIDVLMFNDQAAVLAMLQQYELLS
jgi:hypothetical protein